MVVLVGDSGKDDIGVGTGLGAQAEKFNQTINSPADTTKVVVTPPAKVRANLKVILEKNNFLLLVNKNLVNLWVSVSVGVGGVSSSSGFISSFAFGKNCGGGAG